MLSDNQTHLNRTTNTQYLQ